MKKFYSCFIAFAMMFSLILPNMMNVKAVDNVEWTEVAV